MSTQKKRVAIVARRAPYPPFSGIGLIIHNITVRLAQRYDVEILLTDEGEPTSPVLNGLPLQACGPSGYGDQGARVNGGRFRNQVARYYGVTLEREDWLRGKLNAFRADAVLGFGYDTAPYLEAVRDRFATVADVIDSEVLYLWRQIRRGDVSLATLKHLMTSMRLARQLSACDAIVTVADEDSRNMRRLASHPDVATISNGVDCDFYAPNPRVQEVPGRVIFTGSLNWMPNVQAIEWFLSGCWPLILKARPDATLVIVGKSMQPAQKQSFERSPNVTALGFVDDVRDHVLAAQVSIAPMISGSGIKNKILEAWSMGRAVVATTTASRGLDGSPDSLRVADDHAGFAGAVIGLLGDAALRTRLGENGRQIAVSRYSWDAAADAFAAVVERAYSAHSSRMRS